ncbi:hypothetical protein [Streptomyces sp. NPDC050535]|uniref:hypothetical protein n=1 Tax=Streptomyces sp. NPDC050535 TaxID=3365626 RepID=UPI00379B9728
MTEYRPEGIDANTDPVPRDMPDQQVQEGEDPWDLDPAADPSKDEPATDVPDADEAGTARKGTSRSDTAHPEHPGAEESSA